MSKTFTSAKENIVRINHPVIQRELKDIAEDCDKPLQWVFDTFCKHIFDMCDIDKALILTIADVEDAESKDDIPF